MAEGDKGVIFEKERGTLLAQLSDKDEEIEAQRQLIEKLKDHMSQQEQDYENLRLEAERLERENESAKLETKEVLTALEHLASAYERKAKDEERKDREFRSLNEAMWLKVKDSEGLQREVNRLQQEVKRLQQELDRQKEENQTAKAELNVVLTELGQIASLYDEQTNETNRKHWKCESLEEELRQKVSQLKKVEDELQQMKDQSLHQRQRVADKLSHLFKSGDLARVVAKKSVEFEDEEKANFTEKTPRGVEEDIKAEQAVNSLQKEEIKCEEAREKGSEEQELRNSDEKMSEALEQPMGGCEEFSWDKDGNPEEPIRVEKTEQIRSERREQTHHDLKDLEEIVLKELKTLYQLRKLFVQDLGERLSRSVLDRDGGGKSGDPQTQKIAFLKDELDQLTKENRQLSRENADLQLEARLLEKRVRCQAEVAKSLRAALAEAKEKSSKDIKRYQYEVDRIADAVRQKNLALKGRKAQIAKAIRGGNPRPVSSGFRSEMVPTITKIDLDRNDNKRTNMLQENEVISLMEEDLTSGNDTDESSEENSFEEANFSFAKIYFQKQKLKKEA